MMRTTIPGSGELDLEVIDFYRRAFEVLQAAGVPFLLGGAYALERYTGLQRHTKDFDFFLYPRDCRRALDQLAAAGYQTEVTFPHWLAKAFQGDLFVDIIFGSGNGLCRVDDPWFAHAEPAESLGLSVQLIPVEEMIWSKAFIMERERFDGADVAHLIRARGEQLDWHRLLERFGSYGEILLAHVVLFDFIYPQERSRIPDWVRRDLLQRYQEELANPAPTARECRGTLLSRAQYLVDIESWGYQDPRRQPEGQMTQNEINIWTEAIAAKDVPTTHGAAPQMIEPTGL
jgi:hypothetical protein